ncbi:Serine/threonine-protein phosphatase 2A activator 1, partial [Cryomyces antarcticus]
MGSFGSAQRLDYGTGHELSFLAFLGCIWKLGGFPRTEAGVEERGVVLGVIEPYLTLIRRLILTYTLEPAGSHGVWGLDDHFFIPYIFGSAQLAPAIASAENIPTEGSLADAVDPADVVKAKVVEHERKTNMYFSAIGFIYDVKKGPFWEHSPILFDISGIRAGWAKINKGMLKMYNAEVLSKFPVIQHFPFGSLFVWERDPNA